LDGVVISKLQINLDELSVHTMAILCEGIKLASMDDMEAGRLMLFNQYHSFFLKIFEKTFEKNFNIGDSSLNILELSINPKVILDTNAVYSNLTRGTLCQ
jgi:hypothetical protein